MSDEVGLLPRNSTGARARERSLDSSEVLRAENCRSRVREVALMNPGASCASLEAAIGAARALGYSVHTLGILNISHGGSETNEPRPALLFYREGSEPGGNYLADAIIVEDLNDGRTGKYNIYSFGDGFRYLE